MFNKCLKNLFIFYFTFVLVTPSLVQAQNRPDAGSILKNLENNKITVPKQADHYYKCDLLYSKNNS